MKIAISHDENNLWIWFICSEMPVDINIYLIDWNRQVINLLSQGLYHMVLQWVKMKRKIEIYKKKYWPHSIHVGILEPMSVYILGAVIVVIVCMVFGFAISA
jgi:hypothetical protein